MNTQTTNGELTEIIAEAKAEYAEALENSKRESIDILETMHEISEDYSFMSHEDILNIAAKNNFLAEDLELEPEAGPCEIIRINLVNFIYSKLYTLFEKAAI